MGIVRPVVGSQSPGRGQPTRAPLGRGYGR